MSAPKQRKFARTEFTSSNHGVGSPRLGTLRFRAAPHACIDQALGRRNYAQIGRQGLVVAKRLRGELTPVQISCWRKVAMLNGQREPLGKRHLAGVKRFKKVGESRISACARRQGSEASMNTLICQVKHTPYLRCVRSLAEIMSSLRERTKDTSTPSERCTPAQRMQMRMPCCTEIQKWCLQSDPQSKHLALAADFWRSRSTSCIVGEQVNMSQERKSGRRLRRVHPKHALSQASIEWMMK